MSKPSYEPEFTGIHETDGPGLLNTLLVVIVLYGKTADQSIAYLSLTAALENLLFRPHILIYDNSPQPSSVRGAGMTYLHDADNNGVSAAYNAAANLAEQNQKTWMLFLDQDTVVTRALLPAFESAMQQHPQAKVFAPKIWDARGLLSPFVFAFGRGRRTIVAEGKLSLYRYKFINSGLLIHRATFALAGGYDENVPLDFSDIFFGDRLAKVVDHFILIDEALHHSFSDNDQIPVEAALTRFKYFCKGARAMGKRTGRPLLYLFNAYLRAGHLCFRYKDIRFLIQYFRHPYG